ncbi:MAG: peptidyl-prolyl cis-trans isomerase [Campylobacterales bacterium]|nr:peptidyl-prolyl cis-trans isomerase [Campylobacterales bacterium]
MKKALLSAVLAAALGAQTVGGIAVLVKEKAITLYDVEEEMRQSKLPRDKAIDLLIRKKLEELEIIERNINVRQEEVIEDIKAMAAQNNMSVSELYDAMLRVRGVDAEQFKKRIEEKLLSQKLYSAIAYSRINPPEASDEETYYLQHINEFSYPQSFSVTIYSAPSAQSLQAKTQNPMLNLSDVQTQNAQLPSAQLNPQLAQLLIATPEGSFTQIIPSPTGGYSTFFVTSKNDSQTLPLEQVRAQVSNAIMQERRNLVLGEHFERLRMNAQIEYLR